MPNETMMFSQSPLGNYCFGIYLGNFEAKPCNVLESNKQSETLHYGHTTEKNVP